MSKEVMEHMVNGGIAEESQICQALEKDEYNHVTATYYLLAERMLKNLQFEQIQKSRRKCLDSVESDVASASLPSEERSFNNGTTVRHGCFALPAVSQELMWRKRHCSTVAEESEDEISSIRMSTCSAFSGSSNLSRNNSQSALWRQSTPWLVSLNLRRTYSLRDLPSKLNRDGESNPRHNRSSSFAEMQPGIRKLYRNLSSPVLLKITEEEDECSESLRFLGHLSLEFLSSYPTPLGRNLLDIDRTIQE
ncbi:hypothetical protein D918_05209 [Trichuris suis]|nr:hypothetical protein D918_05209 [Trichuris suis]